MKFLSILFITVSIFSSSFACEYCYDNLSVKINEVNFYIEEFLRNGQADSLAGEQYSYLIGMRQAFIEAQMAVAKNHYCN